MRRIIVSSVVALILIGLVTGGYFFYRRYSADAAEAIRAVPPDAAFVIECRNAQSSLFDLRQTEYWQKILNVPSTKQFGKDLLHIDSVFLADANFSSLWKGKPIVISAHITKADDFDWLFLLEMPRGTDEADVTGFLKKILSVSTKVNQREYEGVTINEIAVDAGGRIFSFALSKGILMCSYTSFLVENAVHQLKNGTSLKSDKSFFDVYKTSGKNTDADFYFNYKSFSHFLGIFTKQEGNPAHDGLELMSRFAEWSEADVKLNSSSLLLNGYASVKDTGQLLAVIRNQQPQQMRVTEILPSRTSYLFRIGISDPKTFFERLRFSSFGNGKVKEDFFKHLKGHNASVEGLKKNLTSWVGNEIALAITESNTANYSNNTFVCIAANDAPEAMRSLKGICLTTEPKGAQCKTELYNGHEIGLIKIDSLLKMVYGKLFEGIQKNYFTSVGNYIVFANQASSLRSFIDDAESKRTLSGDTTFKQVMANSETSSNVFVYLNLSGFMNVIKSFSTDAVAHELDDKNNWITNFSALAFQYSNKGNLIYNHCVFQYSEEAKQNVSLVWTAECDTSIHAKPQVVTDGSSTYFAVQDDANRLYLFDAGGQLLWKKQLDEKILSDIYSIDFFHNGTKQFLFNTSSFLYLIDKSQAYLGNFPIRLPSPASNGCTVADFDNNHDYKIVVACTNQMLYAYEMNGKAMSGWLYNKPAGKISLPLKYFKVKDKDYLFLAADDGKMELLDRQGSIRARVAEKIMISPYSKVVAIDTGDVALAHVVLADTAGNIFTIYTNGIARKIFTNHLAPPIFFDMADINNTDKEDYFLFGSNNLTVQESDTNILFTHEFKDATPGLFVTVSNGLAGSVSPSTNQITLFNADGTIYPGFPVKGSTPFTVTPLTNDGKKYIAAGSNDGNLYLYVVE